MTSLAPESYVERVGENIDDATRVITLKSSALLVTDAAAAPAALVGLRGDRDVPSGCLKPNRLTPGFVGGFFMLTAGATPPFVRTADGGGEGSPPLLAVVRGGRGLLLPSGVLDDEMQSGASNDGEVPTLSTPQGLPLPNLLLPTDNLVLPLPSHSFSLSCDARRGLRRDCVASNMRLPSLPVTLRSWLVFKGLLACFLDTTADVCFA